MRSAGAIFSDNIGIKWKTQKTSCEKSGLETLRNMRSAGAIFVDDIWIHLKQPRKCHWNKLRAQVRASARTTICDHKNARSDKYLCCVSTPCGLDTAIISLEYGRYARVWTCTWMRARATLFLEANHCMISPSPWSVQGPWKRPHFKMKSWDYSRRRRSVSKKTTH